MSENRPNQQLEEFRYDAKLFKQAYRAGIKAKQLAVEEKRKKRFRIVGGVLLTLFTLLLSFVLFRSPLFQSASYIRSSRVYNSKFVDIETEITPSPISAKEFDSEFIEASSALYADLETGQILYEKEIEEPIYIASITKLMSALVALREFELSEVVEVKKDWYAVDGMAWTLGLDKGDTITVEDLLHAMLISSYNDAAFVLADHMDGGWEVFVEEMNNYANFLELKDTKFFNPSGLDDFGANMSTAKDLYRLTTIVYRNEFIMQTASKGYVKLQWDIGEEDVYTTNAIKDQYGNIAGKTGYTEKAGQCFLGITNDGKVTIVLGSSQRFDDSKKLLTEL